MNPTTRREDADDYYVNIDYDEDSVERVGGLNTPAPAPGSPKQFPTTHGLMLLIKMF